MQPEVPVGYRRWFMAAAVYNVLWGVVAGLFPLAVARLGGLEGLSHPPLIQVIGMMVGVYGIGYYLLARNPVRYAAFIWIGLVGKVLGPMGYLVHAMQGNLPWQFGWVVLFNDIIWWPAFVMFAWKHARHPLS